MPEAPQWARVRGEVNCHVRRGAWYGVLRVTPEDVILDVNRQPVRLERAALEIVPLRPRRVLAVPRPSELVHMTKKKCLPHRDVPRGLHPPCLLAGAGPV